jgi:hypothetical protein
LVENGLNFTDKVENKDLFKVSNLTRTEPFVAKTKASYSRETHQGAHHQFWWRSGLRLPGSTLQTRGVRSQYRKRKKRSNDHDVTAIVVQISNVKS